MWRAGLRIQEALALAESDPDQRRGSLLFGGKGGRRRKVGMDAWAWEHLQPWLDMRRELPVGPLLWIINGRREETTGGPPRHAPSCDAPPPRPECGAALRHTSSDTPTPSRRPAKAYR